MKLASFLHNLPVYLKVAGDLAILNHLSLVSGTELSGWGWGGLLLVHPYSWGVALGGPCPWAYLVSLGLLTFVPCFPEALPAAFRN